MPTFKKGQSGNPGGRPAGIERGLRTEWDRVAAKKGGAIAEFVGVVRDIMLKAKRPRDRLLAAKLLAERTWGHPREEVTIAMLLAELAPDLARIPADELARALEAKRQERADILARLLPSGETEH